MATSCGLIGITRFYFHLFNMARDYNNNNYKFKKCKMIDNACESDYRFELFFSVDGR